MPRNESHLKINQFKGVNLSDPDWEIDDGEFASCANFVVTDTGNLERRAPLTLFRINPYTNNPSTDRSLMLGFWYGRAAWVDVDNSGIPQFEIQEADNNAYNGTIPTSVVTLVDFPDCGVLYANNIYLFNQTSADKLTVADWTLTHLLPTRSVVASAPANIHRALIFKDRVFGINGTPDLGSSRVYYSNIADPTTWGNFFDVNPGDGDYITDIIVYQERIYVFKQFSTWIVSATGPVASWTVKILDPNVGAVAPNCVVQTRGLLFVLSAKGLYRCDGVVYDFVGYPIQDLFLNNLVTSRLDFHSNYHGIFACMVDDNIFFSTGNVNVGYWFYNPLANAFTQCTFGSTIEDRVINTGIQGTFFNGSRATLFGCNNLKPYPLPGFFQNSGNIMWFNLKHTFNATSQTYQDSTWGNGSGAPVRFLNSVINLQVRTKRFDFGNWAAIKRHLRSQIEMAVLTPTLTTDADFTLRYYFDRVGVSKDYYFLNTERDRGMLSLKVAGFGRCRRLAMEITSVEGLDFLITGIDFAFLPARSQSEAQN
jgi:hypothetical protein